MIRILAINGSYRDDGVTDHGVETMTAALTEAGATVEEVRLRDYPIEFCLNCRSCTQQPGDAPGQCVHNDGMHALVEKIEQADGFILAAPTNLGSVTAVFKRFMERLIVYAYWPWGKPTPVFRKARLPKKKAVIVSSSAAPGLMGRFLFGSVRQLKYTAKIIGAKPVGTLFCGLAAGQPEAQVSARTQQRAEALAHKLT